jgi:hypothetical protein
MHRISDILAFVFANLLGFFAAPACYHIGVFAGVITAANPAFNVQTFFSAIIITWLICAVFSLGFFFFEGKTRLPFLLAPALIPMAYGLKLLFS